MVALDTLAVVKLWGEIVGALVMAPGRDYAVFEFEESFYRHGWDVSPIHMGIEGAGRREMAFSFPALPRQTFHGLPGLLADALPDKYGTSLIDQWLARQGRDPGSFTPIERLCYMGKRGMGALEFEPVLHKIDDKAVRIDVEELVEFAQRIMADRNGLDVNMGATDSEREEALQSILRVGTSAGGARPKAVIAINDETGQVISGQADTPPGFAHWILKFDGVTDIELGEPREYGRIEYAYAKMAEECGIIMPECRLLEENGRAHFLTRRFDRSNGEKIHMQSLCGVAHYDFNQAGAYSYEQAFQVMRQLGLPYPDAEQLFRRMVFNVIARNQDDHTKNISFLMDRDGEWRLSPAYDVTYAYNPGGEWTNKHQMTINGKRDKISEDDLLEVAKRFNIKKSSRIIDEVSGAALHWPEHARKQGVSQRRIDEIGIGFRLRGRKNEYD